MKRWKEKRALIFRRKRAFCEQSYTRESVEKEMRKQRTRQRPSSTEIGKSARKHIARSLKMFPSGPTLLQSLTKDGMASALT